MQTKLLPEYRSRWRGSPRSAREAWGMGGGALARDGVTLQGQRCGSCKKRGTRPCRGEGDLVDLLHSLAETLKFLRNARIQALPCPAGEGPLGAARSAAVAAPGWAWEGGRVPPCPQPGWRPGRGGTRLSPQDPAARGELHGDKDTKTHG